MADRDELQQRFHVQLKIRAASVDQENQAQIEFDALTFTEQEVFVSAMEKQEKG